ncbi:MAG: dTDP-glucose 4,6-dehydratase [Candidatus Paceibacterota bacterium]|jgi:dTDP-glucose 4,6-dehydratase
MTKILITGGAGFIASNFIRYILEKYDDYSVINIDKLTYAGNLYNLRDVERDPRYKFIRGNICNKKAIEGIFKREMPELVVNFAAATNVDQSIIEPEVFTETNVLGVHILLEAARKFGIKKFLQISTDEVYGSADEHKFKETDNISPNNPYSSSKAGADLLARSYYNTFGLPVVVTRSSNNFGSFQFPEKLIPFFITNLLENKKVTLYGDGSNIRDWIYVLDNCIGIDIVLHKGNVGEAYNIGGGNEKSNLEVTKLILQETGKDESFIEYVKDRPGHDFRYALDTTKTRKLGWEPKHDFEEAIIQTVSWYRNNGSWWKRIKSKKQFKNYKKQLKGILK